MIFFPYKINNNNRFLLLINNYCYFFSGKIVSQQMIPSAQFWSRISLPIFFPSFVDEEQKKNKIVNDADQSK